MPKHYTEAIDEPQKAKPKPKAPKKASMPDDLFERYASGFGQFHT